MTVSSGRGTARQATSRRTAVGPLRPPVFAGTISRAVRHHAA